MKNEIRLALLCMAATAVPAFAQSALPQCGSANFDQTLNAFTTKNPAADAVNQQCLLTVYPAGAAPYQAREYPALYPVEGTYVIELSGGGGGGGGGSGTSKVQGGGGGGGAGAAPSRTVQYLSPGVYKLTIGTGGEGGSAGGGPTEAGNPTSLTKADTGQLVAGFAGADVWAQRTRAAGSGRGGVAAAGGSSGGSGGSSGPRSGEAAQAGGALQTPGFSGTPGQAGVESGRSVKTDSGRVVQATAGGGGGASVGSGGTAESARRNTAAGPGGRGGDGFIRLTMSEPAPQAIAPAPAPEVIVIVAKPEIIVVAQAPVIRKYSLSTDTLFGFNKSTLSAEGEAKLDDIASKLREVNIESITDTGHADRFGSEEYNQKLSESRSETVKAYLVSKGVQSDRISAVGKGESQPVTSPDACKGPATPTVIACLQPDRRVEIEVRGSEKMMGTN